MQSFYHYELLIEHADATITVKGLSIAETHAAKELMNRLLHDEVVSVSLRRIETGEILTVL